MKKLKLCAILLLSIAQTGLQAQEAIPASGGEASGTGGSTSYSVGQVVYTTSSGTENNSIVEGVQQPFEISVVSGIEQARDINLVCTAYPNPTIDFVSLKVTASAMLSFQSMEYKLFDIKGNLVKSQIITGGKTQINMQNYVPATYFLKVLDSNKELKTFKIIKN
jgi:hypothetical protein